MGNGLPMRVCGNAGSNQSSVWEVGLGGDTSGGFQVEVGRTEAGAEAPGVEAILPR